MVFSQVEEWLESLREKFPAVTRVALNYSVQFICWTIPVFSLSFPRADEAAVSLASRGKLDSARNNGVIIVKENQEKGEKSL